MKKKEYLIDIIKSILTFALFFLSNYFILIPIYLFKLDKKVLTGSSKILLLLFSDILLSLILFFIYKKDLIKDFNKFKKNKKENLDIGFKYWFIGLIVMAISNIFINVVLGNGQADNEQVVQSLIGKSPFIMLLTAGIFAPFCEEITFRKAIRGIIKNKWLFIATSAFIFGAMHLITSITSPLDYLYIIPYGSLGFAFAASYEKTDTIFTSIIMHMMHNSILLIMSIL